MEALKNLMRWLNNGGSIKIEGIDIDRVHVHLGDPGGFPPNWSQEFSSSQEALKWAEVQTEKAIDNAKQQINWYQNGDIPWPEEGFVKIPGIGKVFKK